MPLPFLPFGALLALAVLGGAFAVFGAVLRLVDRAALSARNALAPIVVEGFRTWSHQPEAARALPAWGTEADGLSSPWGRAGPSTAGDPVTVVEVDVQAPIATERVRRH